ncbi:MAG TPA: GNAT family N-acetyltransferase [Aggregatilinea sp.]|uniref:GNAT family N-acetyltransferase n=1 Tax=Aggregatilinea sp. TaxID=2806333 RepID=UPI002B9F9E34|nr:GNAT family N-acetyltransferase [Aggregatilinea sp.]HML20335.1 GNAT family N-acetyltransferase [Aggregatilinea sp.]
MESRSTLTVARFEDHYYESIAGILERIGWERQYIDGQLAAVRAFATDTVDSRVFVAHYNEVFSGYISVQFYQWNRLSQIHGLVVDPSMRHKGIASSLVNEAETFVIARGGRGVYVDTPVTNTGARAFYMSQGYQQDYIMTAYYDVDLDGVTYLKLFPDR